MEIDTSKSEIVQFYRDKNVFVTGASGFLGRLLVEKLLRICDVKKIYVLLRPKKGASPKERLQSLFQVPLFDRLRSVKPNFMEKLELVEGDIGAPDLGIADHVKAILVEKIHVVFHGAATVRFEEPMKRAAAINVRGSRDIALLCKEIKNLKAFVHVSTAYCNCPREEIGEMFYNPPITAENLLKLTECLNEDQLAKISETIMGDWPNSYAFSKAVAENAIENYAIGLPVCVFRPGIVISTFKDPIEGWIDNLYGPSGIVAGTAAGLLRVAHVDPNAKADFVPADMCINGIMAAAYKTYLLGPDTQIPIFNFTTAKENPLTYGNFHKIIRAHGGEMPPIQAVWYLTLTETKSKFWFNVFCFLFHIIPALIIDCFLICLRKQPQAMKIYQKIHKFADVLSYFALRSWTFHTHNLQALLNGLNKTDRELFNFDMNSFTWEEMILANARGIRKYIMKEDESNIPAAKRKMFYLHVVHRVFQLVVVCLFTWFTAMLLTPALRTVLSL